MIADQALTLNDAEHSGPHNIECLTASLGEVEQLALDACFHSQIFSLRLDVGVKDTMSTLVDDDNSRDVLCSTWSGVCLTRKAEHFRVLPRTLSKAARLYNFLLQNRSLHKIRDGFEALVSETEFSESL